MKLVDAKITTQSGQAMVEFLLSMTTVMSVLFLAIVMLGKFNDVRNRTLMSARYIAWERTVWSDDDAKKDLVSDPGTTEGWSSTYGGSALSVSKSDSELKGEVMQRVMAADSAPISSTDGQQIELAATQPAMWRDYGGNPLLTSAADVAVETRTADDPDSAQGADALAQWPMNTDGGGQFAAHLSLPTRTLQSGTVSIAIAQNNDVLKRLWPKDKSLPAFSGLTFADTNVLMSNAWVPDGSSNNRAVFSHAVAAANVALVPSSLYQGMQKYAPEISTLQFGRIQQDVVPLSRLNQ
jgi:hypothetical protein